MLCRIDEDVTADHCSELPEVVTTILNQAVPTHMPAPQLVRWAEHNLVHHLVCEASTALIPDAKQREEAFVLLMNASLVSHRVQVRLAGALAQINEAFSKRHIPLIVLKGASLGARYYQPATLRPYTDLDLLAPLDQQDEVRATLKDLGYTAYHELAAEHAAAFGLGKKEDWHRRDGICVDLNYSLHAGDPGASTAELNSYPVLATATGPFRLLPKAKEFTYLCRHAAEQHTFQRLIWLIDLALMAQDLTAEDESSAAELASKWGCLRSVQAAKYALRQLLGEAWGKLPGVNGGPFAVWSAVFGRLDTAWRQPKLAYWALKVLLRDRPLDMLPYALARHRAARA